MCWKNNKKKNFTFIQSGKCIIVSLSLRGVMEGTLTPSHFHWFSLQKTDRWLAVFSASDRFFIFENGDKQ